MIFPEAVNRECDVSRPDPGEVPNSERDVSRLGPRSVRLLPSGKPSRNDAKRFSDFANRIYDTVYQFLEKRT